VIDLGIEINLLYPIYVKFDASLSNCELNHTTWRDAIQPSIDWNCPAVQCPQTEIKFLF